jgi:8-oxo-dGTP pyrophosphatase MutT (NUDIX family)
MSAKVLASKTLYSGKFMSMKLLEYNNGDGKTRFWETVDRDGNGSAAVIIAKIVPDNEILLVKQFRPPANKFMLEFPAGLIDPGEGPETTAHRELLEETGYQGKIISITKPGYSSPGLTGEAVTLVTMEIDGNYYKNNLPQAAPEECERIEVFKVKLDELEDFIASQEALNVGIDSKLYTFVLSRRIF